MWLGGRDGGYRQAPSLSLGPTALTLPSPLSPLPSCPRSTLPPSTSLSFKMASRPVVQVRSLEGESTSTLPLPAVFTAPIRNDVRLALSLCPPAIAARPELISRLFHRLSRPSTSRSTRTAARPTPLLRTPDTRPRPSRGELDAPSRVSPVSEDREPTAPARPRSETCAVEVACSRPPRSGASGTSR